MQSLGNDNDNILISRLILLWILIEIVLGGVLHALKIPLSGLVVGNFAIVCIYLLINSSDHYKGIFRALVIVMTAKWLLSPQASIFSYLAMLIQTVVMLPILFNKTSRGLIVVCVLVSSLYSPIQKLGITYLVVGDELILNVYVLADRWLGIDGGAYWVTVGLMSLYLLLYLIGAVLTVGIVNTLSSGIRVNMDLLTQWNQYIEESQQNDNALLADKSKTISIRGVIVVLTVLMLLFLHFYLELRIDWLIRPGLLIATYILFTKGLIFLSMRYKGIYYESIMRIKHEIPQFRKMIYFCRLHSNLGSNLRSVKVFVIAIIQLFLFSSPKNNGLLTESTGK